MNKNMSKKGAVELSLNLIIMLVIGLTVLGLIIAFVTSFLGEAEDSVTRSLTEDDKTKIEQVLREGGNFAFLSSTLNVKKDAKAKLYIKIRNAESDVFVFSGGDLSSPVSVSIASLSGDDTFGSGDDQINVQGPPITLQAGEEKGYPLVVSVGQAVAVDTYFATFTLTLGDETYTEVVTIEVE